MNNPGANTNPKYRILVVDDNEDIHADFRKILCEDRTSSSELAAAEAAMFGDATAYGNQSQFELDSAFQAEHGLARVYHALQEGRPYFMAFVDVRMPPGLDGIEITPKLWIADPDLQIVICTAYSDYSWEEMFERVGTSDRMYILKKPFERSEVLQLAHSLTIKRAALQENRAAHEKLKKAVQAHEEKLKTIGQRLLTEISTIRGDSQVVDKPHQRSGE